MKAIKELAKKILRLDSHGDVTPLNKLTYLGSTFQGYYVPDDYLDASSVCYCVGAGVDISLDIELATRYGAQVFIFDPMPYAFEHFNDLVAKTHHNEKLTIGDGDTQYMYEINEAQIDTIRFIKTGLWNEKKIVKFFFPSRENYAGHSITNLQNTADFIEAPVNTLSNVMRELNHPQIDLLKIEIEGSEYTVIENLLADHVDVKIILVEFDEFHHRQGKHLSTLKRIRESSAKLLKAGYKMVHSISYYKRTFVRQDVFDLLKNREK